MAEDINTGAVNTGAQAPEQQNNVPTQPQSYPKYSAVDLLGREFEGTKAGSFASIEELGEAYNNLLSALDSNIEQLSPEQKSLLLTTLGGKIENQATTVPTEYNINTGYPELDDNLKSAAGQLHLTAEQAEGYAQSVTAATEHAVAAIEEQLQGIAQQYVDQSRQVFGQDLESIVNNADNVCDKIIPDICGLDGESFRELLGMHGLAGHPAILALLNHIGVLYGQGRGVIAGGRGMPTGGYGAGGQVGLEFFQSPEVQQILADRRHPQHETYKNQLMYLAAKGRRG